MGLTAVFSRGVCTMAFVPPLIPVAMSVGKLIRNSSSDERDRAALEAHTTRKQSVVDRLCNGPGAPISHWSDKHLERMIKTNNVFQEFESELRQCHAEKRLNN